MTSSSDEEYNMTQKLPENPTDYLQTNSDSELQGTSDKEPILRSKKNAEPCLMPEKPANDSNVQKSRKKRSSPPAKRVCTYESDESDDEEPTLSMRKLHRKVPNPSYKKTGTTANVLLKTPKEFRLEKLSSVKVNTGLSVAVPSDYTCLISTPTQLAEKCGIHVISSWIPLRKTEAVTIQLYNVSARAVVIPAGSPIANLSVYKCVPKLEMEICEHGAP